MSPEHNLNAQTAKTMLWFIRATKNAVFLTMHLLHVHFSSSSPSFSLILWHHLFFFSPPLLLFFFFPWLFMLSHSSSVTLHLEELQRKQSLSMCKGLLGWDRRKPTFSWLGLSPFAPVPSFFAHWVGLGWCHSKPLPGAELCLPLAGVRAGAVQPTHQARLRCVGLGTWLLLPRPVSQHCPHLCLSLYKLLG